MLDDAIGDLASLERRDVDLQLFGDAEAEQVAALPELEQHGRVDEHALAGEDGADALGRADPALVLGGLAAHDDGDEGAAAQPGGRGELPSHGGAELVVRLEIGEDVPGRPARLRSDI